MKNNRGGGARGLSETSTFVKQCYILRDSKTKSDYILLGCDAMYFRVPQQKAIYSCLNNYSKILHLGQSGNLGFDLAWSDGFLFSGFKSALWFIQPPIQ